MFETATLVGEGRMAARAGDIEIKLEETVIRVDAEGKVVSCTPERSQVGDAVAYRDLCSPSFRFEPLTPEVVDRGERRIMFLKRLSLQLP